MAKIPAPKIETFKAEGTISKGCVLKFGTNSEAVVQCTASSDKSIGVATKDAVSGDYLEVALSGGGAKGKAGGTIAKGDLLTSNAAGKIVTAASGDRIVGMAMDAAVVNDLFAVSLMNGANEGGIVSLELNFDVSKIVAATGGVDDGNGGFGLDNGTYELWRAPFQLIITDAIVIVTETPDIDIGAAHGTSSVGSVSQPDFLNGGAPVANGSYFTAGAFPANVWSQAPFPSGPVVLNTGDPINWIIAGIQSIHPIMFGKVKFKLICVKLN